MQAFDRSARASRGTLVVPRHSGDSPPSGAARGGMWSRSARRVWAALRPVWSAREMVGPAVWRSLARVAGEPSTCRRFRQTCRYDAVPRNRAVALWVGSGAPFGRSRGARRGLVSEGKVGRQPARAPHDATDKRNRGGTFRQSHGAPARVGPRSDASAQPSAGGLTPSLAERNQRGAPTRANRAAHRFARKAEQRAR